MITHTKGYIDNQLKRDTSIPQHILYDNFPTHDMTLLDNKKVKYSDDVIPRHSPKLGTNQGDANTDDELLLRW